MIIRKAVESDSAALSKICLLTANAGKSSEYLHDFGELPGLFFAVPYVILPKTWGFVMEDQLTSEVVGYVLGSTNTRYFEHYANENWWPLHAERYAEERATKPADVQFIKMLKQMSTAPEANIKFSPAHLHINILEQYQRKGWGRKLIAKALEYLKGEGFEAVWLGIDPRNNAARTFYHRLGFRVIDGAEESQLGLQFFDFK